MAKYGLVLGLALLGLAAEAGAGAWTLPKGKFWGKVTYFQQATDEWYVASPQFIAGRIVEPGDRSRYNFEGEYESKAIFAEGFYGLSDRLDVGVQVPYFDQTFSDQTRSEAVSDAGLSDIRVFAKFRLIDKPFLLTLKTGAKMPTGEFKNEDGLIPVGEGQWDFDFIAQVGRSFWPLPLYGNVDVGYRIRTKNDEIDRDPGDEWFLNAELGYNITRKLMLMSKYELLRSDPSIEFGTIKNRSQIKRITFLTPVLLYAIDERMAVEAAVRISLNGRNYPAGGQFVLGVSMALGSAN
jgi:hypothetical protein